MKYDINSPNLNGLNMINVYLQFVHTVRANNCAGIVKMISTSYQLSKELPKNMKGRSKSSQEWLMRQLADPYVEKARMLNYRCRSAFKLIEIDDKFSLLAPGHCVVDCGAAPGSWTQVAVHRVNATGKDMKKPVGQVIAVDRNPIYPIEGAILMGGVDFTAPSAQTRLMELLDGKKVDIVLSDMAPNATGIHEMDHENIVHLAYSALQCALQISHVGGSVLLKIWDGRESSRLEQDIAKFYRQVRFVKPPSSRGDSAEKFLLARKFKGLKS